MTKTHFSKKLQQTSTQSDIAESKKTVFILHDQLNLSVWPDWIQDEKPLLIFLESEAKSRVLPFHKKKLVYKWSSMRHFAIHCSEQGFPVYYDTIQGWYDEGLKSILNQSNEMQLYYMKPSEWESRKRLDKLREEYADQVEQLSNSFFFADLQNWVHKIEPGYRMEYFYREMRRETGYLMNKGEPMGGVWNYDEKNRETVPEDYVIPNITTFSPDKITEEVIGIVKKQYDDHFGSISGFEYAVNRKQATQLLEEFIDERLADFGPYEDAMVSGEATLFHSSFSLYLNNGLLTPWEICESAIKAYKADKAPINSVEGLIRQILGWREFVRIYYEAMMPKIRETNFFDFSNALPELFWGDETKMHCLQESIAPVIESGYSHHIQRLMVLSNFSNLTETDPRELNKWFWLAYIDAYEWVVLPNVLGMSTFADGGVLASKPYVSSGNYINKMSNYCKHCDYSISKKTGKGACPFNYLYWNFVNKQREGFEKSGRNSFMVSMYDKKSADDKKAIKHSTEQFLAELERS
ncbi:cryptochrome/photolyase family protein [Fodinibius saliphilus]|uniref:cryptochrome/photolyase family protein n=1 Tax=Fodinibius saliphilus TaxID=1920650 RepID=UPI0011092F1F|nr:cryptochrome/photolyase family protein [Fodinibius saliphilus]